MDWSGTGAADSSSKKIPILMSKYRDTAAEVFVGLVLTTFYVLITELTFWLISLRFLDD